MSTLSERTVIQSIKVRPFTGAIEVERVSQVLRDGEVIAGSAPAVQMLGPAQDLSAMQLEPEVLAISAAAWSPAQVRAGTDALLAMLAERETAMQAVHDKAMRDEAARAAELARAKQDNDAMSAGLVQSREALAAAHRELDAEHATLAARSEKVTRDRAELFAQSEVIRKQRPQLDTMLNDLEAERASPVPLRGKSPVA
jgi:hypothetical protein